MAITSKRRAKKKYFKEPHYGLITIYNLNIKAIIKDIGEIETIDFLSELLSKKARTRDGVHRVMEKFSIF